VNVKGQGHQGQKRKTAESCRLTMHCNADGGLNTNTNTTVISIAPPTV